MINQCYRYSMVQKSIQCKQKVPPEYHISTFHIVYRINILVNFWLELLNFNPQSLAFRSGRNLQGKSEFAIYPILKWNNLQITVHDSLKLNQPNWFNLAIQKYSILWIFLILWIKKIHSQFAIQNKMKQINFRTVHEKQIELAS